MLQKNVITRTCCSPPLPRLSGAVIVRLIFSFATLSSWQGDLKRGKEIKWRRVTLGWCHPCGGVSSGWVLRGFRSLPCGWKQYSGMIFPPADISLLAWPVLWEEGGTALAQEDRPFLYGVACLWDSLGIFKLALVSQSPVLEHPDTSHQEPGS